MDSLSYHFQHDQRTFAGLSQSHQKLPVARALAGDRPREESAFFFAVGSMHKGLPQQAGKTLFAGCCWS